MSCSLFFQTARLHQLVHELDEGEPECSACGTRGWPCLSLAMGYELTPETVLAGAASVIDAMVCGGPARERIASLHSQAAIDDGFRRIAENGLVQILCPDYDREELQRAQSEAAACGCEPGLSMEFWPGWVKSMATSSKSPPFRHVRVSPHQPDGEQGTCRRCGGEWPCASMLVGADVDPTHIGRVRARILVVEPMQDGLNAWRQEMFSAGSARDNGIREVVRGGHRLVIVVDTHLEQARLAASPDPHKRPLALRPRRKVSKAEHRLLELLVENRAPMHEGVMAALMNIPIPEIRILLQSLADRGFIDPC